MPELTGVSARLISAVAQQYRVERELGVGGMATVFLARDLKHDRDVAMKLLHPELAAALGGERFLAEIRMTARLQHPHILPLLDSGSAEGLLYYVMPVVSGETLRARLTRERQLPVDDAVRIARDVAAALDYAHRQGIIHRDVKPENILLHEGQALVADFGIALAVSAAGGERMTLTGISLGTPHYMSPEQAMGDRNVDARSDVYSLAAVTYEMLAGEPPFTAPNPQAVLAKVITDRAPSVTASRELVPLHVAAAVDKGLAKLPADRFGSAGEFATALGDARGTPALSASHRRALPSRSLLLVAGVAIAVAMAAIAWGASRQRGDAPVVYDVALPDSAPLTFRYSRNLSISPNGDFLIYSAATNDSATSRLWYRSLRDVTARALAGTEDGFDPNVSPDGRWVLFVTGSHLKIASLTTSDAPRILAEVRDPIGTRWLSPTRFFLVDDDGNTLRWFDPQTGETSASRVYYCISPEWLAAGESLLCGGGGQKFARIVRPGSTATTLRLASDASGAAVLTGAQFRIVDDRYLVYMSIEGELRAAAFDAQTRSVGRSVALVSGIRREAYRGDGQWAVANNGTLVYALGDNAEVGHLVRARDRVIHRLPLEPAAFLRFDMSPDGRRIAVVLQGPNGHELRIYNARDGRYQTWLRAVDLGHPIWSPRGDRLVISVAYDSLRHALLVGSPDATSPPDTLAIDVALHAMSWRSDSLLLGNSFTDARVVWQVRLGARPARLDTLVRDAIFPDLSPDNRLLSYVPSAATGVVVTTFPPSSRVIHVSQVGGEPHWVTSRRLRYRAGGYSSTIWNEVDVDPTKADAVSPPRVVHVDPRFSDTPGWSQRTAPNGDLIYVQASARTSARYVRVVPNWVAQMKRAVDRGDR